MTSRAEIVAALGSVAGVSASPTQPAPISAGSAWPVWRATRWRNQVPAGVRELGWYVLVALPPGPLDGTVSEADPLVDLVGDALAAAELGVLLVEPFRVAVADGGEGLPALRFTLGDRS